jgi:hypothetical protein
MGGACGSVEPELGTTRHQTTASGQVPLVQASTALRAVQRSYFRLVAKTKGKCPCGYELSIEPYPPSGGSDNRRSYGDSETRCPVTSRVALRKLRPHCGGVSKSARRAVWPRKPITSSTRATPGPRESYRQDQQRACDGAGDRNPARKRHALPALGGGGAERPRRCGGDRPGAVSAKRWREALSTSCAIRAAQHWTASRLVSRRASPPAIGAATPCWPLGRRAALSSRRRVRDEQCSGLSTTGLKTRVCGISTHCDRPWHSRAYDVSGTDERKGE